METPMTFFMMGQSASLVNSEQDIRIVPLDGYRDNGTPASDLAGDGSAPRSGNTGGTKRQSSKETGGIDWLETCVYGCWPMAAFGELAKVWNTLKDKAASAGDDQFFDAPGGERLLVEGYGLRNKCHWVFRYRGCQIGIVNRAAASESFGSVFVTVPGDACLAVGAVELWQDIRRLLKSIGFEEIRAVPSRVDVCVDLPGVALAEFVEPFLQGKFVCRATSERTYREAREYTAFETGKTIRMRCYDKWRECCNDPDRFALMIDRRWSDDGVPPCCATRVEFQVRRDTLKEMSIWTVDDLFSKLGSVVEWLTGDWFRLTDDVPDRENHNVARSGPSELWQHVRAMFKEWLPGAAEPVERRRKTVPEDRFLIRQGLGCLEASIARGQVVVDSLGDLKAYFLMLVRKQGKVMLERIKVKQERYQCVCSVVGFEVADEDIPY
jgi:hypothetical protein